MSESKYSPAEEDKKHELTKKRKERFESNPEEFIHVDEIVMAAVKTESGIGILLGASKRADVESSLTRLTYRVFSLFTQIDMASMLKNKESEIILPPGTDNSGGKKIIV